ncbi:MAG: hypothetical protein ACREF4_09535 [Gammaproteobacteria bacterium]
MPGTVTVVGGQQLAVLTQRLRAAGRKDMTRELRKGLNRATKPLKAAAKANAKASLPKRGGLGRRVARTKMVTKTRTGRVAEVRILAKPGAVADPGRIDRGRIKHPVFDRGPWVLQDVTPGWFRKPMREGGPVVQRDLVVVMNVVSAQIGRGF